jgi:TolA-binding protein
MAFSFLYLAVRALLGALVRSRRVWVSKLGARPEKSAICRQDANFGTPQAERLQQLREELATLQDQAEARMREIQADTEAIWKQRRELLEDIRAMASGLVDSADAAAARFPSREPAGPEEEMQEPQAGDETEPPGVATDEPTRA